MTKLESYVNRLSYLMGAYSDKYSRDAKHSFANVLRDTANMVDNDVFDEDIAMQTLLVAIQMGVELMEERRHAKDAMGEDQR